MSPGLKPNELDGLQLAVCPGLLPIEAFARWVSPNGRPASAN